MTATSCGSSLAALPTSSMRCAKTPGPVASAINCAAAGAPPSAPSQRPCESATRTASPSWSVNSTMRRSLPGTIVGVENAIVAGGVATGAIGAGAGCRGAGAGAGVGAGASLSRQSSPSSARSRRNGGKWNQCISSRSCITSEPSGANRNSVAVPASGIVSVASGSPLRASCKITE